MVGPSYKKNERLISGVGEREEKNNDKKADSESTETAGWCLNDSG